MFHLVSNCFSPPKHCRHLCEVKCRSDEPTSRKRKCQTAKICAARAIIPNIAHQGKLLSQSSKMTSLVAATLRRISPALVDTRVYSCVSVLPRTCSTGALSMSTSAQASKGPNKDFKVNPLFENRNPRNLEQMGLARKRQGWVFQSPRKDFYHRVLFEPTQRQTTARVEHFSGKTVVSASTTEWAIKDGLYRLVDVSAAENVGRVLAQRCLECGITNVFYEEEEGNTSEKMQAFLKGLQEVGLSLEEPDMLEQEFVPGVDYSRQHRVGEKKKWKDDYQPV